MIQYGLDIPVNVRGYFTTEKSVVDCTLREIEGRLGYRKGRLKQGAEFYLLSTPNSPEDFDIMGTTMFQGHKMEEAPLLKSINSPDSKMKTISYFKRNRLVKVVPMEVHVDAMRPFLSPDEFQLVKEVSAYGLGKDDLIREIKCRYIDNQTLIKEVEQAFLMAKNIYKSKPEMNNELYPSALGRSVPQWKLKRSIPARCLCLLTNYEEDVYQSFF